MNFLINAAFEDAAFIRDRRLFYFSLPKCGVYKRAAFKRGSTIYVEIVGDWCGFGGVGESCISLSGILVGWWHFGGVFEWNFDGIFNEFH